MFWVTLSAWKASRRGQLLLTAWALAFVVFSARSGMRRKRAAQNAAAKGGDQANATAQRKKAGRAILKAVFRKDQSVAPKAYSALLSAAICARMLTSLKLYNQIGVLASKIVARDFPGLYAAQVLLSCFSVIFMPVTTSHEVYRCRCVGITAGFRDSGGACRTGSGVGDLCAIAARAQHSQ